jgi:outer membrane protein assembly complex protein YaeT
MMQWTVFPLARAQDWEGRPVAAVRHRPENPAETVLEPGMLDELSVQKAGEPYSGALIRESIERLYATGRFTDIRADAQETPEGLVVTFLTQARYFIGIVRVEGVPAPPSEPLLQSATQLQLGYPFDEEQLPAAAGRLWQVLEDDGYFQAEIVPRLENHPERQQVDISFDVRSGERARLGQIQVTGNPVFPAARILEEAEWEQGKRLTSELIQEGMTRLRNLYREENYLRADIRIVQRQLHRESNSVDLELSVQAGTPVEVSLTGADLSRSRLEQMVPIFQEGTLDEDLLREGERNLLAYFESQGYFQVEVRYQRRTDDPARDAIEYVVTLGPRQRLEGIEITGNRYFQTEVLRERMRIQPATLTSRYGRFSRRALDQDRAAIRALYQSNGFTQVEVVASLQPAPSQDGLIVLLEIREGQQTIIGDFSLTGNRSFTEDELAGYLNAAGGQPYSDSLVATDRNNVLNSYWNEGFPAARFDFVATPSDDGSAMDLQYVLDEGEPESVRHIFVGGLEHTRVGIVNRQLQIQDGQPLSHSRLLETQRRLYDLGLFSRVEIAVQNPRSPERQRNVLVYLEEARRLTLKLGLGGEYGRFGGSSEDVEGENKFSPNVSLDLTRLNVGGRPHTASFRSRFSALQRRVGLTYTAPRFLNYEWLSASARGFYDKTRDVNTFTARRWEASLQFEGRRSRVTTWLQRYAFRRVQVDLDPQRFSEQDIPVESQPVLVGLLGSTWIRDTRDVPTNARQGIFTSVDVAVAAKQLGSEASFVRALIQNSSYHRIGENLVFARSTQIGGQAPFGKLRRVEVESEDPEAAPRIEFTRDIPIAERFFSGGAISHRGFGLNQAGPRDQETGFAVGGDALLLNSIELRFPIWQAIQGVLFHDVGNVFAEIGEISLSSNQKPLVEGLVEGKDTDFSFLSHAIGIGLRYQTPVAPVRFDVGYNLNPTRFFVNTKTPEGDIIREPRRLSRWQFLFSVGQTF